MIILSPPVVDNRILNFALQATVQHSTSKVDTEDNRNNTNDHTHVVRDGCGDRISKRGYCICWKNTSHKNAPYNLIFTRGIDQAPIIRENDEMKNHRQSLIMLYHSF